MTTLTVINERPQFRVSSSRPSLQPVDARPRFSVKLNGVKLLQPTRSSPELRVTSPARVFFAPQGGTRVLIARPARGPRGLPGEPGDGALGDFVCGEEISSSSLVHLSPIDGLLYLADSELLLPAHGFTISGAIEGATLTVKRLGLLNGLGGLTAGRQRWLGAQGQTRSTTPSSGIIQNVGVSAATDAIFIELQEPEEVES